MFWKRYFPTDIGAEISKVFKTAASKDWLLRLSFWHSMNWRTEGIGVLAPPRWRQLDGLVGVVWEAETQVDAQAYYLAEDPRIVIYFDDVASWQSRSIHSGDRSRNQQPILRASYIPAGLPMWTTATANRRFSHLNIHIHRDRLLRFLTPVLGSSMAASSVKRPVEIHDDGPLTILAQLFADEISAPSRHSLYSENLVASIVAGLLDIEETKKGPTGRTLTTAQMARITSLFEDVDVRRVPVAAMAEAAGLSESWFSEVFRQTTGEGPLQWQLSRRISSVKAMLRDTDLPLADIAYRCGYTDQSHLTKSFKQAVGLPPAEWKRLHSRKP